MIDLGRWLPNLTGSSDQPQDDPVSKTLSLLGVAPTQAATGTPVPMPGNVDAQSTGGIETVPPDNGYGYQSGFMAQPVDYREPGEQPYDVTTREGVDATNEPLVNISNPAHVRNPYGIGDSPPDPMQASPLYQYSQPGAQMQRAPLMAAQSNGAYVPSDFSPGDSGTSPQTYEQPYNPDEGPHEATPGSVGAQPVGPQYGPPESEAGPPSASNIPGPDQTEQGTPITYQPRSYGPALSEAGPELPPSPPSESPFKPLYDAAGQIVGYVQGAADQAYQALEPARQAAASLSGPPGYGQVQSPGPGEPDYVSQGGSVIRALQTPIRPPERRPGPTQAELDAMTPDQRTTALARAGSLQDVEAIPFQAAEAARQTVVHAAESFAAAIRAGQEGRPLAAAANALWGALQATPPMAGFSVAAGTLDQMLPEANILGVGPGVMVGMQDLIRLGASGVNGLKRAAGALTPDRLAAAYEAPGRVANAAADVIDSAIPAVQRGAQAAGRFIQEGRETARALNAAPETGMVAPSAFGVAAGLDRQAMVRTHVVPPHVSDTLDFPVRIPEDPRVIQAIEAAGGSINPNRGVTLGITRAQGRAAAGGTATRGGVFYEAVPEGGVSSYANMGENARVGGNQVIPRSPTTYRSPLVLDSKHNPGGVSAIDSAYRQLGVRTTEAELEDRIAGAFDAAGVRRIEDLDDPTARRLLENDLRRIVGDYGGDPALVGPMIDHQPDIAEIPHVVKENILSAAARREGYDGVLTVVQSAPNWNDINLHPAVITAEEQARSAGSAYRAAQAAAEQGQESSARVAELGQAYRQAQAAVERAQTQAERELSRPQIRELMDVREAANPTPGQPNPAIGEAELRIQQAKAGLSYALEDLANARAQGSPTVERTMQAEVQRYRQALFAAQNDLEAAKRTPYLGEPGYTLRSDIPRREAVSETANVSPGVAATAPGRDILGTISRDVGSSLGTSTFGAAAGAALPAETDEERRQHALTGAAIGLGAGPLASRLLARGRGGALATFGASPSYRPPTPEQLAAAEARGAARGARLNQEVTAPASEVPASARLATAATDDRAGLRWAEDVLTDAAGSPRLAPNDVARPSTQSRINAGGIAEQRIQRDLEPAVIDAGRAGLQHELPQYLEDMQQRDILDNFYQRGRQEAIDKAQPGLERMRAKGASAEAIQQAEARIEQAADAAGVKKMRTRQGSNPDMTYEAIDTRLQAQESRLKADGRWSQLQDSASAIWDHNAQTRQRLVDAGELSADDAARLAEAYPHYVPTVPLSHLDPGGVGPSASTAGAGVSRGSERIVRALEDVGTSGERLNPIVATRAATIRAERAIGRNQVFTSFAQMFEDALSASPGELVTPGGPKRIWNGDTDVSGFIQGEPATIRVPKPVADGLAAAGGMGVTGNAFTAAWRRVTQAVAQTLTSARLSFLPVNMIRDFQDYAATTAIRGGGAQALPGVLGTWFDEAGKAALDVARAYAVPRTAAGAAIGAAGAAAQGDENTTLGERARHAVAGGVAGAIFLGAPRGVKPTGNAAEYLARGGGMGSIDAGWRASQRWYRDVLRDGGAVVKTPADAARYLGDWLADIASLQGVRGLNERAELISRTAAMRRAEAAGAPTTEAMIAGRDASVDFDRAGTVTRAINGFIPFTNASVQGSAQLVRMIRQNPAGAATTIATTVGIPMAALEWWNRSDPQRAEVYNDIPDYAKNTGMVAVMPWAGRDNRGDRPNWLYIPTGNLTPFVVGMRAALSNVPGLEPTATRETDPGLTQRAVNGLGAVLEMFSPIRGDSLGAAASSMIPPVAKQAVELSQNRDLFRGSAIVTDQADERASAASKNVSDALNAIGRQTGNDWLQNVRPSAIEYLIRQPAAYGDLLTGVSDLVAPSGYKQSEDRPVQNEPFTGGLVGRFVRDTGGANLERARADMLTESVRSVLADAGMRPSDFAPVPSSYRQAPLTRDEQLRWQQATNSLLDREMAEARRTDAWRNPATRQKAVTEARTRAMDTAAERVLRNLNPDEIKRRQRTDQSMKAAS